MFKILFRIGLIGLALFFCIFIVETDVKNVLKQVEFTNNLNVDHLVLKECIKIYGVIAVCYLIDYYVGKSTWKKKD